jgi:CubicO group peptidase (beta-lactamase class C family)
MLEGFDSIVDQALKDFNVPGLGIGVVVDGHVIFVKGYGYRDVEKKLPNNGDTLFAMGSGTKAFTTCLMGILMEEGLLYWDQPVSDILPEFRLWDQYATQNLTLRDLITHRSGMPRHDFMWYNSGLSRDEILKKLRYLEPTCDIRERYNYNNLMYMVAGLAMERVGQKSWEELTTEKILKPLGMNSSHFSIELMKKSDNAATPYVERNGKLRKMNYRDVYCVAPGAALNSNMNDMTHWLQMLLARGAYNKTQVVSPATLQEIEAPQVIVSGYPENKEALLNAYGLGWGIVSYRGHYYVSHDAGIDGFTSVVSILPQNGIGIVVAANKNLTGLPRYITLEVMDRVLELPLRDWLKEGLEQVQKSRKSEQENKQQEDLLRKKGTTPSHDLSEYAGIYEHPGYGPLKIEVVDGRLQATLHNITSTLDHWHYDVFSIVAESEDMLITREGVKYTFRNNVNGDIEELIVPYESNSPDIIFTRRPDGVLSNLEYYRQFTGPYEIYGVVVEIAIRDRSLIAIIPGQPVFELIPVSENEFTVKSMSHYSVRFVKSPDGIVDEALLVLPYGAFGAVRIRP